MPVDPRHLRIAKIVLEATGDQYRIAVGGGNCLILHGLSDRFTRDVDFFVGRSREVPAAARTAARALTDAGYLVHVTSEAGDLVELSVQPEDDPRAELKVEFAYFTYGTPVQTDAGPTVPAEDQIKNKFSALCTRLAVRDYVDIAHILASGKYTLPQLIEMTLSIDGLGPELIADAGQHLETITDRRIERYLTVPGEDGPWIRNVLAVLPTTPEAVLQLMGWETWPAPPPWEEEDDTPG